MTVARAQLARFCDLDTVTTLLLGAGYAAAVPVVARFAPVVRERRRAWLVVHHLGIAAIVAGWTLRGRASAAAVNGAWLIASSAWYTSGRRRRRVKRRTDNPHTPDTSAATP